MSQSIAIAGAGAVLASGWGVPAFWQAALDARAGSAPIDSPWLRSSRVAAFAQVAAADQQRCQADMARNLYRYCTPSLFWGASALRQAIDEAGITPGSDGLRYGLYCCQGGFTYPSMASYASLLQDCRRDGVADMRELARKVLNEGVLDPFLIIKGLSNGLLGVLSLNLKLQCEGGAFMQGVSGNLAALREARAALLERRIDVAMVVGAGSELDPLGLADLLRGGAISAEGATEVLPFDRRSRGGIAGEGAVALVLRRREERPAAAQVCLDAFSSHARLDALSLPDQPTDFAVCAGSGRPARDRQLAEALLPAAVKHVTSALPITGLLSAAPLLADLLLARCALLAQQLPAVAGLEQPVSAALPLVQGATRAASLRQALVLGQDDNGFSATCLLHLNDTPGSH
ncbi:beta-ketoacyl synthase [Pseudomonas sp. SDI]|uniref:beta-ketoacyl synthase N-terminal-like domain-containing protein n=1 Tax=Pseudomonas sp. SDI TaxID=2170734 RepID=UPI000DE75283|nr:beta-ketoacyl synthase N-terminal-like domain-containing protein [Pseudomonas sp. SDI]PWB35342.1 beta-ketoacyl synthase [Pseudomonas sp. SDI]